MPVVVFCGVTDFGITQVIRKLDLECQMAWVLLTASGLLSLVPRPRCLLASVDRVALGILLTCTIQPTHAPGDDFDLRIE